MSENTNCNADQMGIWLGTGLTMGAAFGLVVGAAFGNVGLGVAFGAAFGLIFGTTLGARSYASAASRSDK